MLNKKRLLIQEIQKERRFLDKAPDGYLKVSNKSSGTYYYHAYLDTDKKEKTKYINKMNALLPSELAKKNYYKKLLPILNKQLEALEKYESCQNQIKSLYNSMSDARKHLIGATNITVEEKLKKWKSEKYMPNNYHNELKKYETNNGELVRSKSELFIANALYDNRDHLLYKYERPLEIIFNGRREVIYPDFTIINIHTGKVTYWEHAGLMGDIDYVKDFVLKNKKYNANNIFCGEQLVYTFETLDTPLDIATTVNIIIQRLIEETV